MIQSRLSFGNLGWRGRIGLVLATALGLAAAGALIVLSLAFAVVLIPLVAIAFVVGRWRLNRMMKEAAGDSRTITTDYTVLDGEDRERR